MKLYNILENNSGFLRLIKLECQEFLEEAGDVPLEKWCSGQWPEVHRAKVRKRKNTNDFIQQFNSAFSEEYPSILNRSVIINEDKQNNDSEKYFIFPVDGFKYIYCSGVNSSKNQFTTQVNEIVDGMGDSIGKQMAKEMFQACYKTTNLREAIVDNDEIIVYNIPVFYAVRANTNYANLLEKLKYD